MVEFDRSNEDTSPLKVSFVDDEAEESDSESNYLEVSQSASDNEDQAQRFERQCPLHNFDVANKTLREFQEPTTQNPFKRIKTEDVQGLDWDPRSEQKKDLQVVAVHIENERILLSAVEKIRTLMRCITMKTWLNQ